MEKYCIWFIVIADPSLKLSSAAQTGLYPIYAAMMAHRTGSSSSSRRSRPVSPEIHKLPAYRPEDAGHLLSIFPQYDPVPIRQKFNGTAGGYFHLLPHLDRDTYSVVVIQHSDIDFISFSPSALRGSAAQPGGGDTHHLRGVFQVQYHMPLRTETAA